MRKLKWFLRSPLRTFAFFGKELFETLRQPRLIASLILGPFLILLLFGMGYSDTPQAFRTEFVHPDTPEYQKVEAYFHRLQTPQLTLQGSTPDLQAAMAQLRANNLDVIFDMPAQPFETITAGRQVTFTLYHNQIDPVQAKYLEYFGSIYVSVLNRVVLEDTLTQLQGEAQKYRENIRDMSNKLDKIDVALGGNDYQSAAQEAVSLKTSLTALQAGLGALAILGAQTSAQGTNPAEDLKAADQSIDRLAELLQTSQGSTTEIRQQVQDSRQRLRTVDTTLERVQKVPPQVMVSPFTTKTESINETQLDLPSYFAPGVVALLLQHLAITVAGLALVRERLLGSVELFRASPVTASEILMGKFLSYAFLSLLVSGVLLALLIARQDLAFTLPNAIPQSLQAIGVSIPSTIHMVLGLGVPMRGTWLDLGVTLLLLDAASLAFGFVISALSNTETQAVQLTMLVLLMSVFFSGFFLNLGNFLVPIRYVAYLLPVSYAIQQLQAIMLRGLPVDLKDLAVLGGGSVLLFLLAYWLFKRQLVSGE